MIATPDYNLTKNPFLVLKSSREKALAGVDVEVAEQAVKDSEEASRRASAAMAGGGGSAPVGGGAYSRLRGRKGGVQLGGLMTGGLAAANRQKLAEEKKAAILKGYSSDYETLARSQYAGLNEKKFKKAMNGGATMTNQFGQTYRATLDDAGQLKNKY